MPSLGKCISAQQKIRWNNNGKLNRCILFLWLLFCSLFSLFLSQPRITYVALCSKIRLIAALAVILATDIEYRMLICVQKCHFWFGHHSRDCFHSCLRGIVAHTMENVFEFRIEFQWLRLEVFFFSLNRFEGNNNVIPFLCVADFQLIGWFSLVLNALPLRYSRWFCFCSKLMDTLHEAILLFALIRCSAFCTKIEFVKLSLCSKT